MKAGGHWCNRILEQTVPCRSSFTSHAAGSTGTRQFPGPSCGAWVSNSKKAIVVTRLKRRYVSFKPSFTRPSMRKIVFQFMYKRLFKLTSSIFVARHLELQVFAGKCYTPTLKMATISNPRSMCLGFGDVYVHVVMAPHLITPRSSLYSRVK